MLCLAMPRHVSKTAGRTMRRAIVFMVLAALATAACGLSIPGQPSAVINSPSDGELLNLRIALDKCLTAAARRDDDGKSDPNTIALAIKAQCVPEAERLIRAVARAAAAVPGAVVTPQEAYVPAKRTFEDLYAEIAIKAVLAERNEKRSSLR